MENCETDKFAWMSNSQYLNYLAIELLEKMGNTEPTQTEIDFVENLLARLSRRYQKFTPKQRLQPYFANKLR